MNDVDPTKYRFVDHNWLGTSNANNIPTDVYYGNILLGVIESSSRGYVIVFIIGPLKSERFKKSPRNEFKTKIDAAKIMHKIWTYYRNLKSQKYQSDIQ